MLKIHILTSLFFLFFLNVESTSYLLPNDTKDNELWQANSTDFPAIQEALDFILVGALLQANDSCQKIESKLPNGALCSYYIETEVTTRAIIVTSPEAKFMAVLFADINSIEDVIFDPSIVQVPFGPHADPIIEDVLVRAGYNDLLFYYGLFFDLLERVQEYYEMNPDWIIYTSGHGVGGGLSLLMAAGISKYLPDAPIKVITSGTPVVGDKGWANYINNNANIDVWRYVLDNDSVPRIRISNSYFHVGNTFQLNKENANIFYHHYGDSTLGYAGVPPSWDTRGLINPVKGFSEHVVVNYYNYLMTKSKRNPKKYYADEFVECTKITCPEDYDGATV